jgi:RNA polymerase sigma-32 factor
MHSDHLTRQEERALVESYRQTHDRRLEERLLRSQIGLVHVLAGRHATDTMEREDLVQEGLMGLLKAIRRFDPARGVRLSTYAAWWIRAYQSISIIKNHRLVRVGTTQLQRRLFFRLRRVRAQLLASGIEPTPERLGLLVGARPAEVLEVAARLDAHEVSLDAPAHSERPGSLGERMAAPDPRVDELAMAHESEGIVRQEREQFRTTLSGRQRELFDARWGGDEAPTLQALGERYGVSRQRIRQIERALLDKLGRRLGPRLTLGMSASAP